MPSPDPAVRPGLVGVVDRIVTGLALLAGLIAVAMMGMTVVDVTGRGAFNNPLAGAFELTELMMAAIVFLALPLVTWRREHVTVTLFYEGMPRPVQSGLTAFADLIAAITCGILSWRAWLYSDRLFMVGERTLEFGIPRGAVPLGVSVVLAVLTLLFLVLAVRAVAFGDRTPS